MHKYCKAYKLADVRQFSGWSEKREENETELPDESICYIWDDLTVVKSPVQDKGVLFDNITSKWREFCVTTLKFEIPEYLRYAYQQEEQEKTSL